MATETTEVQCECVCASCETLSSDERNEADTDSGAESEQFDRDMEEKEVLTSMEP